MTRAVTAGGHPLRCACLLRLVRPPQAPPTRGDDHEDRAADRDRERLDLGDRHRRTRVIRPRVGAVHPYPYGTATHERDLPLDVLLTRHGPRPDRPGLDRHVGPVGDEVRGGVDDGRATAAAVRAFVDLHGVDGYVRHRDLDVTRADLVRRGVAIPEAYLQGIEIEGRPRQAVRGI